MIAADDPPESEFVVELWKDLEPFTRGERLDDLEYYLNSYACLYKSHPNRLLAIIYSAHLCVYLQAHKIDSAPLADIFFALGELELGNVSPLLERSINNRPKDMFGHRFLKTVSVTAMELLIDTGLSRIEAARKVAAVLLQHKYVIQTKRSDAQPYKTVLGWYKRHERGPFEKQTFRDLFNQQSPEKQMDQTTILSAIPVVLGSIKPLS